MSKKKLEEFENNEPWVAFYVDELCGTVGMAASWWLSPYEDGDYEQASKEEVLNTVDYVVSPGSMKPDSLFAAHQSINIVNTLWDSGDISEKHALQCLDMRMGNGPVRYDDGTIAYYSLDIDEERPVIIGACGHSVNPEHLNSMATGHDDPIVCADCFEKGEWWVK